MDHKNRDYFAKPLQHSRSQWDYGNTHLEREGHGGIKEMLVGIGLLIGLCAVLLGFAVMVP